MAPGGELLDGSGVEVGERRAVRIVVEHGLALLAACEHAAPVEHAQHARARDLEQRSDLGIGGRGHADKAQPAGLVLRGRRERPVALPSVALSRRARRVRGSRGGRSGPRARRP